MSVKDFTAFVTEITQESSTAAKDSASVAGIIGDYDKSLTGEAKGLAVMEKLVEAAQSKGYDVNMNDLTEYVRTLKVQYEMNPMFAAMMDSYCSTTCHLASVVGKGS